MCVVSEELSRGYIGVGSLGTRSEIAAELILAAGTPAQKEKWLPGLASGEIIPTAVFTEPNVGSDLASIKTRAERDGRQLPDHRPENLDHPCGARRSDDRDGAHQSGREEAIAAFPCFSSRSRAAMMPNPFPVEKITGGEIEVLGYRGMKEFDVSFDGFEVPADALLGRGRGTGLQTTDGNLRGGPHPDRGTRDRRRPERAGPRLALCAGTPAVRQAPVGLSAGRGQAGHDGRGDHDRPSADLFRRARKGPGAPLRSRGGHGQAFGRTSRLGLCRQCPADSRGATVRARISGQPGVVCDARILSIFEGAAEIQAHVIARRILQS